MPCVASKHARVTVTGRALRHDIATHGLGAHRQYGTFQLEESAEPEGPPLVAVAHVHGRHFLTPGQRLAAGWPAAQTYSTLQSLGAGAELVAGARGAESSAPPPVRCMAAGGRAKPDGSEVASVEVDRRC
jgi:hypothetical protein